MQLQKTTNVEEMRALLDSDEYDFRYDVGVTQPSHTSQFADLDCIVQSLAMHYSVVCVKAELDDMVDGLKTLDVLGLIRTNGNKLRPLFVCGDSTPPTVDNMIDMFAPKLSPIGSNRRESEEEVVMQWVNYLQMIESKFICVMIYANNHHFSMCVCLQVEREKCLSQLTMTRRWNSTSTML